MMNQIFIPDIQARKKLAVKLNLKYDDSMQDWEYEVSDHNRLSEFINEYDKSDTSDDEKQCLMEILIDSLNELFIKKQVNKFETYFEQVVSRIEKNNDLHNATLNYWIENKFEISEKLKNKTGGNNGS